MGLFQGIGNLLKTAPGSTSTDQLTAIQDSLQLGSAFDTHAFCFRVESLEGRVLIVGIEGTVGDLLIFQELDEVFHESVGSASSMLAIRGLSELLSWSWTLRRPTAARERWRESRP